MSIPPTMARWLWPTWIGAVVLVFPVPGTIALRNLLLIIGLLGLLAKIRGQGQPQGTACLRKSAWIFGITTLWLGASCIWIAAQPAVAFASLRGDWFIPMIVGGIAAFAAARCLGTSGVQAASVALAMHLLSVIAWQTWLWIRSPMESWKTGIVPFGERDIYSTLCLFLLAIALGRLLSMWLAKVPERRLEVWAWLTLVVSLLADMSLRTRNGTIVASIMIIAAVAIAGRRQLRLLALLGAVAIIGGTSIGIETRWTGLGESLAVGWSSESEYWKSWDPADKPVTPSGSRLEESAYARAAWGRQALEAIAEHPLGLGFGRDAFGRAVEMKYGYKGMVSSHSGWLDFALAAGIPGLALVLLTAALAIRGGWRQFRAHDDPAGLMFSFLVGGYMLRCLLDGHMSGWRLGLFAFLCGVLIAAMKPSPKTS